VRAIAKEMCWTIAAFVEAMEVRALGARIQTLATTTRSQPLTMAHASLTVALVAHIPMPATTTKKPCWTTDLAILKAA
jgi:hypothetical protein